MKEQIETAVSRRNIVAGDSDEARKSATVAIPGALGKSYKAVWCNKLNWELIRILA